MKKNTKFVGTRGGDSDRCFSEAIMNPAADFGGLWAPESVPVFDEKFIYSMQDLSYKGLAFSILREFGVDLPDEMIKNAVKVYDGFDDPENPVPVEKVMANLSVAELYHGPTRAFKDMALQPFPKLVSALAQDTGIHYLVLAATSGDTGPAALSGFRDLPNTKVVCLYPEGGTSDVQKQQMVKEAGENLKVIGVKSDFDATQKALKDMINSDDFRQEVRDAGYELSAANSVNFGRIMFQIVYHFWSYYELVRQKEIEYGDEITSIIPSGNFGNGLAAFYAKLMGLPISKIILASNENDVLTEFINKGRYDLRYRDLIQTNSPAMDILVSSNIERLLFHMFGYEATRNHMENLKEKNFFELTKVEHEIIRQVFAAEFATNDEVVDTIGSVFKRNNYNVDPHTATAFEVYNKLKPEGPCMIASTAEWTKFVETMSEGLGCLSTLDSVSSHLAVTIPESIAELAEKPVVHDTVIEVDEIEKQILNFIWFIKLWLGRNPQS